MLNPSSNRRAGASVPRRLLVMDAGTRRVKLLLLERTDGGVRCLESAVVDFLEEGLLSAAEAEDYLRSQLQRYQGTPLALVLPQRLVMSHVVDYPSAAPEEIDSLVRQEGFKLGDLSEGRLLYDYRGLTLADVKNPFWIALARTADVEGQLQRLPESTGDIFEIVPTADALASAWNALQPEEKNVLLVDLGARHTSVAIISEGGLVFATSIPAGTDSFAKAIAGRRQCSLETAESILRTENLLGDPTATDLHAAVAAWRQMVQKICEDWFAESRPGAPDVFRFVLGGGGAQLPGLHEFLGTRGEQSVSEWPKTDFPHSDFAAAYGAGLLALQWQSGISLLPPTYRQIWRAKQQQKSLNRINVTLLALLTLLLAFGTWQQMMLLRQSRDWISEAETALRNSETAAVLSRQVNAELAVVRPVVQRQRRTVESLRAFQALQRTTDNPNLWYVLFADQQSYFTQQPEGGANPPAPSAFIAEVCFTKSGEAMRQTLSDLVESLKAEGPFRKVDTLAAERKRPIVDPKLILPNQHFALSLEYDDRGLLEPVDVPERSAAPVRRPTP